MSDPQVDAAAEVNSSPSPRLRPGAALWQIYRHDLPRIIRELCWLIVALALIEIAGAWFGYRAAMQASFDAMMKDPSGLPPFGTVKFVLPFVPNFRAQIPAWYGYAGSNSLLAIWGWCYSVISGGAYAIYSSLYNGWHLAWLVGSDVPLARAASGFGLAGAAATLLPHGVIEIPVFVFARALALRAGLAWFWRIPGYGRWGSVKREARDFRRMLLVIVPLLLVAGLLEAGPAEYVRNRYLLGVGLSPGLASERRVLRSEILMEGTTDFAMSLDGSTVAKIDGNQLQLLRKHVPGTKLLFKATEVPLYGPAWSPDGKRIAVLSAPFPNKEHPKPRSDLFLIDVSSGAKQVFTNGKASCRSNAPSWSPVGDEIAVWCTSLTRDASGKRPRDLWAVAVKTGKWRQITHLPASVIYAPADAAWSPDGRQLAFVRSGEKKDTYGLWVVRADGSRLRPLTRGVRDASPAWSPDGKWIAFLSRPAEDFESAFPERFVDQILGMGQLTLIRADGTGRVDGIAKADEHSQVSWGRDSKTLYYTRFFALMKGVPRAVN